MGLKEVEGKSGRLSHACSSMLGMSCLFQSHVRLFQRERSACTNMACPTAGSIYAGDAVSAYCCLRFTVYSTVPKLSGLAGWGWGKGEGGGVGWFLVGSVRFCLNAAAPCHAVRFCLGKLRLENSPAAWSKWSPGSVRSMLLALPRSSSSGSPRTVIGS